MNGTVAERCSLWVALWGIALLSACVTINVYFPAAAAEKAADRIIEEVWGKETEKEKSSRLGETAQFAQRQSLLLARGLLEILLPSVQAQQADLDISSPSINAIKNRMQSRHEQLKPFYDSGAIGLTPDGLVTVRDPKAVSLADRQRLNSLTADENRDRNALYAEIARANGRPEWEQGIRDTFARRWVENARSGWWYQTSGGWKQK
ncbi:MAG: YdbL family protein [Gammaproteobacteria bacterium]|nr:YdbL family protein [Gammaproteobacteria bacterium]